MSNIAPAIVEEKVKVVSLTIDGRKVQVKEGDTVLTAAQKAGIYVPTLCHDPDLKPYGACCLCVVEVAGMKGLPTSCTTPVTEGMVVNTESANVTKSRRLSMELIMANHHGDCLACAKNQKCDLQKIARYLGVDEQHFSRLRKSTEVVAIDDSHPAFIRDHNKCILCAKCVRACHEIAGANAIDLAFRGNTTRVATFANKDIKGSACESCGECVSRCPTGALVPRKCTEASYEIKTVCPYCGVGCSLYLGIRGGKIVGVRGDYESPVNKGGLCVKGRFGFDFVNHPDRLTKPLIRNEGYGKDITVNGNFKQVFREATWEEAINLVADRLTAIKNKNGANSIGVLSSAKFTNEENYLMEKFTRAVIGTNNIDHCARLCHASTVVAAMAAFGEGAMSNSISDFTKASLLFVIGSNTTECHPIIGRYIRQAVNFRGTQLIVADPRGIDLSKMANICLRHKPGTDVALINAMMNVIISENLEDKGFIEQRTEGYEELKKMVEKYTPEMAEQITGVPASEIVKAARAFASAERAAVLYGMGITQHTTGTDNVKSLANLLMLTGNMGCEGTGFSPLRGQNNVQGSCDMGALPNVYPGYQKVIDPAVKAKFEKAWGVNLDDKAGKTVTDMMNAAFDGNIKALYVAGENPVLSEPYQGHVNHALKNLEFLVVQDIFPTETAVLADVILPAAAFAEKDGTFTSTERRVQRVRKAINPPGEAKADWEIISAVANKMGGNFSYNSPSEIMDEVALVAPIYGGIRYGRLDGYGLQWPCLDGNHPGTPILHKDKFSCGLGKFHAVEFKLPAEAVSEEYPLIMTTGRVLNHWHTGSMSRRSEVLDKLSPNASFDMHPQDALKLGIKDGDFVTIASRRGKIEAPARITEKACPGLTFMAFHWKESPVNALTNNALDPQAKIPEFKVSAVKAVLSVLERAVKDNEFFAKLAANPAETLKEYNLTPEEKAAIASGDVRKIESWVGKLDDRLKEWLLARLSQESW